MAKKLTLESYKKAYQDCMKIISSQQDEISNLHKKIEEVHKQQGTVPIEIHNGILDQIKILEVQKDQIKKLFEFEKKKRSEDKENLFKEIEGLKSSQINFETNKIKNVRGAGRKKFDDQKTIDQIIFLRDEEKKSFEEIAKHLEEQKIKTASSKNSIWQKSTVKRIYDREKK